MRTITHSASNLVWLILAAVGLAGSRTVHAAPPAELRVSGNQIQTVSGRNVWLQGLNVASLEWSAGGEHVLRSIGVGINEWNANVIRLPVKESFWFGREKGQTDGGEKYRALVDSAVEAAAGRGAYLIIDLHRFGAPTEEHAAFWRDAAKRYANHPAVLYELFNEPHGISWDVWRDGGEVKTKPQDGATIAENAEVVSTHSVGMQALVDAVRQTGAKNVVLVGGLDWSYDLGGILAGYALNDRGGNGIVYSTHVYPWKRGWREKFLAVAEKHPVLVGETGAPLERLEFIPPERHEDPYTWVPDMLGCIQQHRLHWTAWCFHPKAAPAMLQDWNYTPTPFWGAFAKQALAGKRFEMKRMR